ncbi:helix-turn-helix transcriptional regulator [Savagea sp. SN6]|uniref:Helix-turn-helix transcriptional regulator n=1 Tax=Savagea serpentis TaxID=2785297 RepID=A0A8J7KHZ2_9BACL|nr:helix-turn-helix transcriptional regulator [Savagea serpentis]MBF4501688.1 helix-turn-helix transcriptional regulator [Savagea serpentis]
MQEWSREEFGKRLNALREQRNLSMSAFGEAIGTSASRIKDWEQGKNAPSAAWIAKISDRFNVSTDELIIGKEERREETSDEFRMLVRFEQMREMMHDGASSLPFEYAEQIAHFNENKDVYRGTKGRKLMEFELMKLVLQLPKKDVHELYELAKIKYSYVK